MITDETLRFLASGTVHEKDKHGLFDHWDPVRSMLGTVSAWSDYERQHRYQDHLGRDRNMSPAELQRARARLAEQPPPLLDGHVIVVEPRSLDKEEVSADAIVVDPANKPLCRLQVTARSRVEVVALGGDGAGARDAREHELVKELRWQLHLALAKTTQPIKFDSEVNDPTANLRKL